MNLVLNPETFWIGVRRTGRFAWAKKQFQIFEILLSHPRRFSPKKKLYEAVWEEEVYLPGDNTLNAQWKQSSKENCPAVRWGLYWKRSGAWCSLERKKEMWGLVLILVVLCPFLGFGLCSCCFCFKGFAVSRFKRSFKAVVGYGCLSGLKKELVAWIQASQWSLWSDWADQSDCLSKRKRPWYNASVCAHDIRTPLTIASGYTQQIIKGGTRRRRKSWSSIPFQSSSRLKTPGISLGMVTLDGGSHSASVSGRRSQPSPDPAVVPVLW